MKKKLLLLIEDNPLLTGLYKAAFENADFEVTLAHDGKEGLELAKAKKPDGIILDLLMPGLSGFDVLRQLGEDDATRTIKTIVLTSVEDPAELEKAKKLGALDCLVKSQHDLDMIVKKVLSHLTA